MYFRRSLNQFPILASKKLADRKKLADGKGKAGGRDKTPLATTLILFFAIYLIFPVCVDAAGDKSSHSGGVDVIQDQQAAWPPHIQHGRALVLSNKHLAIRWSPYWLCIRAQVLPSP
jgi:hypothetical protein